jgi:hypothetical protein
MIKNNMFIVLACVFVLSCGFGGGAPSDSSSSSDSSNIGSNSGDVYMIDDFEDGNFSTNPEWWSFDNIKATVVDNAGYQGGESLPVGKKSVSITGTASDWYAGGMGSYLARKGVNLGRYNCFQMDVYGFGPGSGTIKIELVDDDKGNWQVEQDAKGVPLYNDKFIYNVQVDWKGWKRVTIPFNDFSLDNPGNGNGEMNFAQVGGKGGLLQVQFIFIGPKRTGSLKYNLDNISFVKK